MPALVQVLGHLHDEPIRAHRGQASENLHTTRLNGSKQKLGPISKQGDQYLRRILVVGGVSRCILELQGDDDVDAKRSRPSIGKTR